MTADIAHSLSAQFEKLGWNHTITVVGPDRMLTLNVNEMGGTDLLSLFGILAPGGVPLDGVDASLSSGGLVVK